MVTSFILGNLSSVISLNYFSEIVVLVEEGVKVFLKDVRVMDLLSPGKVLHTGNARNFTLIKPSWKIQLIFNIGIYLSRFSSCRP